ncbi:MAG: DUF1565 domain-containing protein [Spirochaetales bacterium]|nr:DUF1565 domain-containing protein [Spirochaetales bacterium]MCF7937525.1 DUF1565 domain-containing protein [Spirochaetales bacterium]
MPIDSRKNRCCFRPTEWFAAAGGFAAVAAVVLLLFVSCWQFNNPVDPQSEYYQGYTNERLDFQVGSYVHAGKGTDAPGYGSREAPYATIQYAVNQASAGDHIAVAAGTYSENITINGPISIHGGFHVDDWQRRDIYLFQDPDYRTEIPAPAGDAIIMDGTAVPIGRDTEIEGFVVNAPNTAVVLQNNASPAVKHNVLDGQDYAVNVSTASDALLVFNAMRGGGLAGASGLYVDGSEVVVGVCEIFGGSGAATSYGIQCVGGGSIFAFNSRIVAGEPTGTGYGVSITGSSLYGVNNEIAGAIVPVTDSHAVDVNQSNLYLVHNTIESGLGTGTAQGVRLSGLTGPETVVVKNNIIVSAASGSRNGLYENGGGQKPDLVQANNFYTGGNPYYDGDLGAPMVTIGLMESNLAGAGVATGGNMSMRPFFVDRANGDFRLSESTPPGISLGASPVSFGDFPANDAGRPMDKDGNPRSEPWSVGAHERNQGNGIIEPWMDGMTDSATSDSTSTFLNVGDYGSDIGVRALLGFDIHGLDRGSIGEVSLHLYRSGQSGAPVPVLGSEILLDRLDSNQTIDTADYAASALPGGDSFASLPADTGIGWVSVPVRDQVFLDLSAGRYNSQYRLRFPVETDFNGLDDYLQFYSVENGANAPYLRVEYSE